MIAKTIALGNTWWLLPDLNRGHKALQASALPTELKSHTKKYYPSSYMIFLPVSSIGL